MMIKLPQKQGFFQALGIAIYCSLIGLFVFNAESIIGKVGDIFGSVLFLLLLSTSVLICGTIVFYKPYKFFSEGKKKDALDTVIFTAIWLLVFITIYIGAIVIFN